jgi:hypothetical protein
MRFPPSLLRENLGQGISHRRRRDARAWEAAAGVQDRTSTDSSVQNRSFV